uniref:50S ribosomal protein L20 n=1 Tax=Pyrodinium bahamense TaxID=73915 RepID=A0A7S0FA14_9DINO|mmetsp:Transcript_15513/g.42842  ORF Transcript_15513/g.42842 Transcript_15513/m.42842 type:complete len:418 (+) Transcript_15513:46-1299(+)
MGLARPRERVIAGSMAAATLAAAASWSGAGPPAPVFTVVGRDQWPQGRGVPRHTANGPAFGPPESSSRCGEAAGHAWPQLVAVAGALAAAARVARRQRAAIAPNGKRVGCGAAPFLCRPPVEAHLSAARGDATASSTGRGARVITKVKTKRGMYAVFRRREMWLKHSQHFFGRKRNCYRQARQAVMAALKQKYKSRRLFKRERRTLWIMRVRANSRLHGITYSQFICKMKEADINLNRKILSQIGVYDRPVFTNIMNVAIPQWKEIKARKEYVKPPPTVQEIDDVVIPYIEKTVPELYTDATIRFNRQVKEKWVEYTVDMGDPDMWREVLPKMPELANFNLPDHWMANANAEFEDMPLEMVPVPEGQESQDYVAFMQMVKKERQKDAEKAEKGEPAWPTKEGVSREDWFKEEPQSWF